MTLRLAKQSLPRNWTRHPQARGIILERDLSVGHGRLKAKLLVFDTAKTLREFWKGPLGKGDLGRYCAGVVNGLYCEILTVPKRGPETRYLEADPRYFCCIGLVRGKLTMEIIAHEAVHAAYCYVKRRARAPWDAHAREFDEEAICYPAGRIAAAINRELHAAGLYK